VPPAEASKGAGGWAVVDPNTGVVHGVIVGTINTYNERKGVIGHEYMGCSANCVLRYQTNATSDGNVAGWNGPNVKWNEPAGTFTISGSSTDTAGNKTTTTQTLVPEKTASDGKNLSTGIVSSVTTHETAPKNDQTARAVVEQKGLDDANAKTTVTFPEWSGGKSFEYQSPGRARANLQSDVKAGLRGEGFVVPDSASGGAAGDSGAGAGAGESGAGDSGAGGDAGGTVVAAGDAAVADASASASLGDEPVADGSGDGRSGAGGGDEGDVAAGEGDADGGGEPADDPSTSEPDVPVFVQTILDLTDQVKTFLDDFFGWFGLGGDDAAGDEVAAGDDAAVEPADEVAVIE